MDKVKELLELLTAEIRKVYPEMTNAAFSVDVDGYRSIRVEKWKKDPELPTEAWKRRELLEICRLSGSGEWSKDRSDEQNEYYKYHKCLLED
jgi:hypothetical protein